KHPPKDVRVDVGTILRGEPLRESELDEAKTELLAAGLLEKGPRKSVALSDAGKERVNRALQIAELTAPFTWSSVVTRYLLPLATGLPPVGKLSSFNQLAALVLKRKYGLTNCTGSSINAVLDAIVCSQLGYPGQTSWAELRQTVLRKVVNSDQILPTD